MQNIFRDLEISRQIIELIRTAHSKIILASPTIEFWQQLNEEIALVINNQINVVVITEAHPDTNSNALDRLLDIGVTIRIVQIFLVFVYVVVILSPSVRTRLFVMIAILNGPKIKMKKKKSNIAINVGKHLFKSGKYSAILLHCATFVLNFTHDSNNNYFRLIIDKLLRFRRKLL